MLATSALYLVVQIPSFLHESDAMSDAAKSVEHIPAYVGFGLCMLALLGYCVYQILVPKIAAKRIRIANELLEAKQRQLKAIQFVNKFPSFALEKQPDANLAAAHLEVRVLAVAKKWRRMALADAEKGEDSALLRKEEDSEEDEEEDDPRKKFAWNIAKSTFLLVVGTAVCAIFSDPMVNVINAFWSVRGHQAILRVIHHHTVLQ